MRALFSQTKPQLDRIDFGHLKAKPSLSLDHKVGTFAWWPEALSKSEIERSNAFLEADTDVKMTAESGFTEVFRERFPMSLNSVWGTFFADEAPFQFHNFFRQMDYENLQHSRWKRIQKEGILLEKRIKFTTKILSFPWGTTVNGRVRILVFHKSSKKIGLDIEFTIPDLPFSAVLVVRNRWIMLQTEEGEASDRSQESSGVVSGTLVHNSMMVRVENSKLLEALIREKAQVGMTDLCHSWFRLAEDQGHFDAVMEEEKELPLDAAGPEQKKPSAPRLVFEGQFPEPSQRLPQQQFSSTMSRTAVPPLDLRVLSLQQSPVGKDSPYGELFQPLESHSTKKKPKQVGAAKLRSNLLKSKPSMKLTGLRDCSVEPGFASTSKKSRCPAPKLRGLQLLDSEQLPFGQESSDGCSETSSNARYRRQQRRKHLKSKFSTLNSASLELPPNPDQDGKFVTLTPSMTDIPQSNIDLPDDSPSFRPKEISPFSTLDLPETACLLQSPPIAERGNILSGSPFLGTIGLIDPTAKRRVKIKKIRNRGQSQGESLTQAKNGSPSKPRKFSLKPRDDVKDDSQGFITPDKHPLRGEHLRYQSLLVSSPAFEDPSAQRKAEEIREKLSAFMTTKKVTIKMKKPNNLNMTEAKPRIRLASPLRLAMAKKVRLLQQPSS